MLITSENYMSHYLRFRDRQAGISIVFDHTTSSYLYNVYCIEAKVMRELFSKEHQYLEDAVLSLHDEFGTWELVDFEVKSECGSCVAK